MFLFCDMFCFFTQLIRAKSRTFLAIGMNVILKIGILIFYHKIVFFVVLGMTTSDNQHSVQYSITNQGPISLRSIPAHCPPDCRNDRDPAGQGVRQVGTSEGHLDLP